MLKMAESRKTAAKGAETFNYFKPLCKKLFLSKVTKSKWRKVFINKLNLFYLSVNRILG